MRGFRYNLRILFAVVTMSAVMLAFAAAHLNYYSRKADAERDAKERLHQFGAEITTEPFGPNWVRIIPSFVRPATPQFTTTVTLPLEYAEPTYQSDVIESLGCLPYLKTVHFTTDLTGLASQQEQKESFRISTEDVHRHYPEVHVGILVD